MNMLVSAIIDNRLVIILACFAVGIVGMTTLLARHDRAGRVWKYADLIWVAMGGLGAITALLAGLYADDSTRLERQIDISFATAQSFDRDAARFRLHYCEGDRPADVALLCEKVEFLSASSAINADLPLFSDVMHSTSPLRALRPLIGEPEIGDDMDYAEKLSRVRDFDPVDLLSFDPLDSEATGALIAITARESDLAADYRVLAGTYQDMIESLRRLKAEWEFLQANSRFVLFQVLALCMIAIAAPFRLGKSLVDLRAP